MNHFNKFFKHLKDSQYSKSTIENYYYALIRAKKYFDEKGLSDETQITEKDILVFFSFLKEQNVSTRLYYRVVLYLKIYFKYLEDEKIIFLSPLLNIDLPKEGRNPTKTLTQEEIKECLSKIPTKSDSDIRVKTILEVLYSTAIRPMELLNLTLNDVDYKKGIIFIKCGKNKKDRIVPIGETALFWLNKYISEIRAKYLKDKNNIYIFISHHMVCKKINYQGLYATIRRAFKRYNLKKFNPYSLRSSSATHLLQNGMSIFGIKELLGHDDITTTQSYLRVKTLDLKRELNKKHPRNKIKGGITNEK